MKGPALRREDAKPDRAAFRVLSKQKAWHIFRCSINNFYHHIGQLLHAIRSPALSAIVGLSAQSCDLSSPPPAVPLSPSIRYSVWSPCTAVHALCDPCKARLAELSLWHVQQLTHRSQCLLPPESIPPAPHFFLKEVPVNDGGASTSMAYELHRLPAT